MSFETLNHAFKIATRPEVVIRAVIMAVIVGSILIAINQVPCIMTDGFSLFCMSQCALTFCVPYMVSTISSVLAVMQNEKEQVNAADHHSQS